MKKTYYILSVFTWLLALSSCEDYLDKSPDMGLAEKDVYKDYNSFRGFLDQTYTFLANIHAFGYNGGDRTYPGAISDELASLYNSSPVFAVNSGNWLINTAATYEIGSGAGESGKSSPDIYRAYRAIRIANIAITNIGTVPGLTEQQIGELMGQAHFMRAWFYFQLIKRYGGMPIFDKVFIGDGDEDLPRVTYHESHAWMMNDIETAIGMLPDSWDDANMGRVNKLAAMAFKEMVQLYDASPLMQNDLTSLQIKGYDKERAKQAAQSASAVLAYIQTHPDQGVKMVSQPEYPNIFHYPFPPYIHPEYLWYNRTCVPMTTDGIRRYIRSVWLPSEYAKGTGNDAAAFNAPTQNMIDMFEKKGQNGVYYPIADSRSGYDMQQMFADRDPRLTNNILVPGEKWGLDKNNKPIYITLYQGGTMANSLIGNTATNRRQQTGYMCKKFMWEGCDQYKENFYSQRVITAYIRMAQVYLDLAEASFEATGSATQKVEGCMYSAEEAVNIVRNRVGVTNLPIDIVSDPDKFREAYRRERCVELMFEDHRWWDIRRWMTMHEIFDGMYPIKGLKAIPLDPNHNKVTDKSKLKFSYEIIDITPEVRAYGMRNYWYPFPLDDANSMKNLVQNPGW